MKSRKLRIAWSVAWGVVAVLLCVLWVRSYSIQDHCEICHETDSLLISLIVDSNTGQLVVSLLRPESWVKNRPTIEWLKIPAGLNQDQPLEGRFGFDAWIEHDRWGGAMPHWSLVLVAGALSTWQAIYRNRDVRFSLRTLLLVTTAFAVLLGLIVYLQ